MRRHAEATRRRGLSYEAEGLCPGSRTPGARTSERAATRSRVEARPQSCSADDRIGRTPSMGDVYIAYATPQVSEALALATCLETAGFGTIVVDVDCPHGTPYVAWVHETIERVRVLIALLPATPVERVMRELRLAETLGKPRI